MHSNNGTDPHAIGTKLPAPEARYDMVVIGAGPAGLYMADFALDQLEQSRLQRDRGKGNGFKLLRLRIAGDVVEKLGNVAAKGGIGGEV